MEANLVTLHDAHNRTLHEGDKVFFSGVVERIDHDGECDILWVRPDMQPEGFTVSMQCHPRTVSVLPDES